jgi:hypothetical protein
VIIVVRIINPGYGIFKPSGAPKETSSADLSTLSKVKPPKNTTKTSEYVIASRNRFITSAHRSREKNIKTTKILPNARSTFALPRLHRLFYSLTRLVLAQLLLEHRAHHPSRQSLRLLLKPTPRSSYLTGSLRSSPLLLFPYIKRRVTNTNQPTHAKQIV